MDAENPWDTSVDKPFSFLSDCIKKINDQAGPEDVRIYMSTNDPLQAPGQDLADMHALLSAQVMDRKAFSENQCIKLMLDLSELQGNTQVQSEASKSDERKTHDLLDIFEIIADQYERNLEKEDLIYKLETLNNYPHVLGKKSIDLTSTAVKLLSQSLDYTIERQTELCERLTAIPSEEEANKILHVKAEDQESILNSFAQIVMFVNNLKDLTANTEAVPSLTAALEQLLPRLTLSGDSLSQLEIQFDGMEDARSILEVMTDLRSAFDS